MGSLVGPHLMMADHNMMRMGEIEMKTLNELLAQDGLQLDEAKAAKMGLVWLTGKSQIVSGEEWLKGNGTIEDRITYDYLIKNALIEDKQCKVDVEYLIDGITHNDTWTLFDDDDIKEQISMAIVDKHPNLQSYSMVGFHKKAI